nr:hypothetical protein [Thioalkalivibrio nitratireducens]
MAVQIGCLFAQADSCGILAQPRSVIRRSAFALPRRRLVDNGLRPLPPYAFFMVGRPLAP